MLIRLLLLSALLASPAIAQEAKPKPDAEKPKNVLTLITADGSQIKVDKWSITAGTWRLPWLAAQEGGKKQPGPVTFMFRENDSTTFADGIVTLVPLASVRALTYDYAKKTATLNVATNDEEADDIVLTGSAGVYVGFNVVTLSAEVDKGALGIAELKYSGGQKGGIKGLRFSAPTPIAAATGKASKVFSTVKDSRHKVHGLGVLYRSGSDVLTSDILFFRKTLKLPIGKLLRIEAAGNRGQDWKVSLKGEEPLTLTILPDAKLGDRPVRLHGVCGRVAAGWKLFPLHTVTGIDFPGAPPRKAPEEPKKGD